MIKILIAENIPCLNKGEMAIFGGMCETFKVIGKVKVYLFSVTPEIDNIRYRNKAEIIDLGASLHFSNSQFFSKYGLILISIWAFLQHLAFLLFYKIFNKKALKIMNGNIWNAYIDSDLIIVGHNGVFGPGGNIGTLYLMPLYIPLFLKILGKPVVIYGASIGHQKRFKWVIETWKKLVINKVDLVTLRDEQSYKELKERGIKNKQVFVLPDPAFLLQPADSKKIDEIISAENIKKGSEPLVGVTITREIASFSCPKLTKSEERYIYHNEMVALVIDNLVERLNANVIFLPHCIGLPKTLDDRIVSSDIYALCKNKRKVKVITSEYTAEELKGLIGKCDLFIGERIHSVIGAISMGVPSLAISHASDRRLKIISGVFNEKDLVYEVDTLNESSLLSKIIEIWVQREIIKERLTKKAKTLRQGAMKNGELLKEILEKRKKVKLSG